jgi:hypothetical protein
VSGISSAARGFKQGSQHFLLALLACLSAGGCLGPTAVSRTRTRYNEVYRATNDEQLLLNIVRLRYADSPIFIDLSAITSQFEASARANYAYGLDGAGPGLSNLGFGELFFRDTPTLSYHPRSGRDVAKALLSPLSAELFSVVNAGANIEQFMLLALNEINDLPNAARSIAMVPTAPDDNLLFRRGVRLLSSLEQRGAVELTMRNLEDNDTVSDPIPVERIRGGDLVAATKENYVFRRQGNEQMTVRKQERTLVLRIRDQDRLAPEAVEMARIFRLVPGKTIYKIKSELTGEHPDRKPGTPDERDVGDTVYVNMRSMLQMAVFLSKGVRVPPEHVQSGVVPMTPMSNGQLYDWTNVTAGIFCVQVQPQKPKRAEAAVKYRGYWFFIAPDDVQSRSAMAIFEILFAVQESEGAPSGPVLTLPVGGG